jgi:hypothetical protein
VVGASTVQNVLILRRVLCIMVKALGDRAPESPVSLRGFLKPGRCFRSSPLPANSSCFRLLRNSIDIRLFRPL